MHIEIFFAHFEKYCNHINKEDQKAWVQVLPDYLTGEPKRLALEFCLEANYDSVKQKLVEKYRRASRFDDGDFEIFSMRSESLAKVTKFSP